MKKQLITVPNPQLRQVTEKVTSFDKELLRQTNLMRDFLKKHEGAGLAANQIGFNNRVLIVELDCKGKDSIPFQIFINPEIVESSPEKESLDEGCLSVPQIELPVERSQKIKLKFQNLFGKKKRLTARGILGRILQHEIDHLWGIVFIDQTKEKFYRDFPELKKIKIVFLGTGPFAAIILEGLILLDQNLQIITEKAKIAGRSRRLKPSPVVEMAQKFNRKFYEVENIANFSLLEAHFDLLICADFGQKIPSEIFRRAKIAPLVIHPSLLPKYRGPSPIQNIILDGDKTTGVTIIRMAEEFDQGPILGKIETEVLPDDNSSTLTCRLATWALKLLFEALPKIVERSLAEIPQNDAEATYTHKLEKSDGKINWQESIETIERKIRAFSPWPGAYTFITDERLIIHRAHLKDEKLVLDIVQKEGKKPMPWQDFLRGFHGHKPFWFDRLL